MSQVSAVADVDVLVVDNASTDGTADVVQCIGIGLRENFLPQKRVKYRVCG
jgi:glycosyltransferase involved in cell wall biosynthesis